MTNELQKEILEEIEREQGEYNEGFKSGLQFAKQNDLSIVEAVVNAIDEQNMDRFCQVIRDEEYEVYCNSSSQYQDGFHQALKEILKRTTNVGSG